MKRDLFKSDEILVVRIKGEENLRLINLANSEEIKLNEDESILWTNWRTGEEGEFVDKLVEKGFLVESIKENILGDKEIGKIHPKIVKTYAKYNVETKDLTILFNSMITNKEPSFYIIGAFGSLCWRLIIQGKSIKEISDEVINVFGSDRKLIPFIKHLIYLKMIEEIEGLECNENDVKEGAREFTPTELLSYAPQLNTPWFCSWEICSACNLRCKHCYLPEFGNIGLDTEDAMKIVDQFIKANIFEVVIMGGEPLLRNDLELIIRKLRENGVYVTLITNGQLLTYEKAKSLVEAGLCGVLISIDGFKKEIHEAIRGEGTFDKTIEAIENAKRAGMPRVAISMEVNSINYSETKKIPGFLSEMGLTECFLEPFKQTGLSGSKAPFDMISGREISEIKSAIKEWKEADKNLFISFTTQCLCGRVRFKINQDGNAYLCSFLDESVGNLKDNFLLDLWKKKENEIPDKGPAGYCKNVRAFYLLHLYG